MYVEMDYYTSKFKGEPVESAGFSVLCQRAGEIVEELTLYRLTEEGLPMMPETTQKLVKNAVCAQIEYLDANGGAEMDGKWNVRSNTWQVFLFGNFFRNWIHGTVHIFAEGGKNLVADWSDLSRRELLMRPIPKRLLIHTATLYQRVNVDKWGKGELNGGQELSNIRIEPSKQIIRDKNNAEVQLAATLFYDCRNSRPSDVSFEVDQVVDFNGQKHQIKTVETLYDNLKLHHYEIGMVRYGKD